VQPKNTENHFMPYLILIAGALLGIYALMTFFQRATPAQVVSLLQAVFSVMLLGGCLLLAVTGRVGPAIAIAGAMIPMFVHFAFKKRNNAASGAEGVDDQDAGARNNRASMSAESDISSRKEALEVLGLDDVKDPSKDDVITAYKNLMKKMHPDHGGNDYFAQKLSAARDYLLK